MIDSANVYGGHGVCAIYAAGGGTYWGTLCLPVGITGIFEKHLGRKRAFVDIFGLRQPNPNFWLQMGCAS